MIIKYKRKYYSEEPWSEKILEGQDKGGMAYIQRGWVTKEEQIEIEDVEIDKLFDKIWGTL